MDVKIEDSWKNALKQEFNKPYFMQITTFLKTEKLSNKTIYPPGGLIFNAFNTTAFEKVKIVLLGQDPDHRPGQAHGVGCAVQKGVRAHPSLLMILKKREKHVGLAMPGHGNLTR